MTRTAHITARSRASAALLLAAASLVSCAAYQGTPDPVTDGTSLSVLYGQIQLDGDLQGADRQNLAGVEFARSDLGHGFGLEAGFLLGDSSDAYVNPSTGNRTDLDLDVCELYVGARRSFDLGIAEAHLGAGLSLLRLEAESDFPVPGTGSTGTPIDTFPGNDTDVGGYLQGQILSRPWRTTSLGLWGRVRTGGDLNVGGDDFGSTAAAYGLALSVSR